MNQTQENKKNMIDATVAYMDENAALYQSIAKIGEGKNELDLLKEGIEEAAEEQAGARSTIGKTKLALKKALAIKLDILNDLVEVKALLDGDDELARQMGDSKSALYRLPYDDFIRKGLTIIQKATGQQEALTTGYGLTQEQLTDVQAGMDNLLAINGQPREYSIKSSVATRELETLFDQADDLLNNRLDNLIKIFKNRDANFYNGYLKARMIVDY